MIYAIVGGIGSGKTLFLTFLANMYYSSDYDIYSNYEIKHIPMQNIDRVKDFLKIESEKSFFAVDEAWLSADSRQSQRNRLFSTQFLQSRKKHIDIGLTTQDFGQIDVRIRNVTQMVFEPEIIKRQNDEKNGKPLIMKVSYFDVAEDIRKTNSMIIPLIMRFPKQGVIDIPNSYSTYQVVEAMESQESSGRKEAIGHYHKIWKDNPDLSKSDISARMIVEMGINKSEAGYLTNYLDWAVKNDVDVKKYLTKEYA